MARVGSPIAARIRTKRDSLQVDASKARARLGWTPRLSLEEGLRWTVEWYQRVRSRRGRGGADPRPDRALRSAGTATVKERDPVTASACRLCGQPLSRDLRRSRAVAARQRLRARPRRSSQRRASIRCTSSSAAAACSCSSTSSRARSRSFSDYCYFSSFSDLWLAHCRRVRRRMVERFGLGAQSQVVEVASNDGYLLQYFSAARRAGARASSRPPTSRRRPSPRAFRRRWPSSAPRRRSGCAARGVQADLIVGQQRARARARLQRLRARAADPAEARRACITIEVPHLLRLVAENAVRHDLPRALLLLSRCSSWTRSSPACTCASSTSRSSRRTAGRCASTCGTPTWRARRRTAVAERAGARTRGRARRTRRLSTLRGAGRADEVRRARVLHRGARRGRRSSGTARRRRATRS